MVCQNANAISEMRRKYLNERRGNRYEKDKKIFVLIVSVITYLQYAGFC